MAFRGFVFNEWTPVFTFVREGQRQFSRLCQKIDASAMSTVGRGNRQYWTN